MGWPSGAPRGKVRGGRFLHNQAVFVPVRSRRRAQVGAPDQADTRQYLGGEASAASLFFPLHCFLCGGFRRRCTCTLLHTQARVHPSAIHISEKATFVFAVVLSLWSSFVPHRLSNLHFFAAFQLCCEQVVLEFLSG